MATPTKEDVTPTEKKSLFDMFCGCMGKTTAAVEETKPEATSDEAEPTKDETPAEADTAEAAQPTE